MKITAQLIKSISLPDFPSGSACNYYGEKFYITGDDATHLWVLDKQYNKVDAIKLFDNTEKRIEKSEKVDLEASTLAEFDGATCLLLFGSASKKKRKRMILLPFSKKGEIDLARCIIVNTKDFVDRIESLGLEEINLEGSCMLTDKLLLGNRGNRRMQKNHLLVTVPDFWKKQQDANLSCVELILPDTYYRDPLGVSELCYVASRDLLILTFTSEATDNAYDDGAIGDSHIAWITNASQKLKNDVIHIDELLNLTTIDPAFKQQKIEGLCLEHESDNEMFFHLVSDNDCGSTHLFNIKITVH